MSAYLSFYKDKECKEHLLTVSRINSLNEIIQDADIPIGGYVYKDNDYVQSPKEFTQDHHTEVALHLSELIRDKEKIIGLSLINKVNREELYDLKEDIEELYDLIKVQGKLQILAELMDFKSVWTLYG